MRGSFFIVLLFEGRGFLGDGCIRHQEPDDSKLKHGLTSLIFGSRMCVCVMDTLENNLLCSHKIYKDILILFCYLIA